MSETNAFDYFKNGIAVGLGVGLAGGIVSTLWYRNKKTLSPDQVLRDVKTAFLKEGPIEGSWITFSKEPLRKFAIHSQGYRGGISRKEDGELVRYEFLADAYTGTVLQIEREKNDA